MTREIQGPPEADGTPPQDADAETPLHLKASVDRSRLLSELSALMQNMLLLRYPHASREEKEAVKQNIDSETREILLPKIPSRASQAAEADKTPPRVKARRDEKRKELNIRDALKRARR